MKIPAEIVQAVAAQSNERDVAEAQRVRDAEVFAHAVTWHPGTRFKRNLKVAQVERACAPSLAGRVLRKHGDKAGRVLLDLAHLARHTPRVVRYVTAWHIINRNERTR